MNTVTDRTPKPEIVELARMVVLKNPACMSFSEWASTAHRLALEIDRLFGTRNQCDGCCRGLPTRRSHFTDIHYGEDGVAVMACTKKLYQAVANAELAIALREIAAELERNNAPLTKADRDVIYKRLWALYE